MTCMRNFTMPAVAQVGRCQTCAAFYDYADGSNIGECRAQPPVINPEDLRGSIWPKTANFEWCLSYVAGGSDGEA